MWLKIRPEFTQGTKAVKAAQQRLQLHTITLCHHVQQLSAAGQTWVSAVSQAATDSLSMSLPLKQTCALDCNLVTDVSCLCLIAGDCRSSQETFQFMCFQADKHLRS